MAPKGAVIVLSSFGIGFIAIDAKAKSTGYSTDIGQWQFG